jgi:hypothetical protein
MIWTLRDLVDSCATTSTEIDGEWVPARPINWKHRSIVERIREAWAVFTGRAGCFRWPKGQ